jgi:penicillin-binding protein 1A
MAKKKTLSEIKKNRGRKEPGGIYRKLLRAVAWLFLILMVVGVLAGAGLYFHLSRNLPKISTLADYRPPIITTVYSDDNRKIAEFCKERRIVVPLSKIPRMLVEAFVSAEDSRFYTHQGIDFISIFRAFFKNLEAGTIVQGGSTITQQVTKSFFLTPERSYTRKIKEAILAYRIDKAFSKDEVLYLYLNQIYLGHGTYGVEAASEDYFGKHVQDLNLAECAILAGLPQAPSRYSPFRHPKKAKQRQIYVLNRMVEEGYITNIQATEAINTPLDIKERKNWYIDEVPYYTEYIRRYVEKTYGADALYTGGLKIYTTVNIEMQKTAREEIEAGLRSLDKRQGYRGPIKHLAASEIDAYVNHLKTEADPRPPAPGDRTTGVVVAVDDKENEVRVQLGDGMGAIALADMRWARKPDPEVTLRQDPVRHPSEAFSVGDVIRVKVKAAADKDGLIPLDLDQIPLVQGALMCIEAETGYVKTMVGGSDFSKNQFNRAIQSRRQPGSAFKPIIYAAAIDKGYTPASVIIDSPIVFTDSETNFKWKPKNYEDKFHGPTLLRDALAHSRNIISIKLLRDIGIDYTINYARKLGITSPINRNLSIALGSSGLSLQELLTAYSVFANYGYLVSPIFITKIVDRDGNVLELNSSTRKKVIDKTTAYIITSMLESVVKSGTGWRVRALDRPVAGKTGTTNDLYDAWFIGYTPRYITGVWVGFDEEKSLGKGETGSRAASPIWLGYMKRVLADKPVRVFEVPDGVVFAKIDEKTGLLPIPESKKTRFEVFKEGTQPTEYTKAPEALTKPEDLFKSDL